MHISWGPGETTIEKPLVVANLGTAHLHANELQRNLKMARSIEVRQHSYPQSQNGHQPGGFGSENSAGAVDRARSALTQQDTSRSLPLAIADAGQDGSRS